MMFYAIKDPDSIVDFTIDWSRMLASSSPVDAINTSIWIMGGVTVSGTPTNTTATATAFVSGGVAGTQATMTNRITTAGGRTYDRTITLLIRQQ